MPMKLNTSYPILPVQCSHARKTWHPRIPIITLHLFGLHRQRTRHPYQPYLNGRGGAVAKKTKKNRNARQRYPHQHKTKKHFRLACTTPVFCNSFRFSVGLRSAWTSLPIKKRSSNASTLDVPSLFFSRLSRQRCRTVLIDMPSLTPTWKSAI